MQAPFSHTFSFAAVMRAPTGIIQWCCILHHKPAVSYLV